ncbi:hypothetical protein [Nannocystis exedens]|uniref:hypothetical protein n=1 Tax=Nannocystis exedens TaxID=54 RepID=UPI000BBA0DB0|nr:hypothetical protein [Nannocystis exedens]PCC68827.1 hypothetical protein NAEX_01847 [Nannocystis exedens]
MTTEHQEQRESLWILTAAPAIWLSHFLLSYITGAIWCAKFAGSDGSLGAVRVAMAVYTSVALGGLALIGWRGRRRTSASPRGEAGASDRFLGHASLLLSGLAAVAILYASLVAVFIRSCR